MNADRAGDWLCYTSMQDSKDRHSKSACAKMNVDSRENSLKRHGGGGILGVPRLPLSRIRSRAVARNDRGRVWLNAALKGRSSTSTAGGGCASRVCKPATVCKSMVGTGESACAKDECRFSRELPEAAWRRRHSRGASSFALLRISPAGSDARRSAQPRLPLSRIRSRAVARNDRGRVWLNAALRAALPPAQPGAAVPHEYASPQRYASPTVGIGKSACATKGKQVEGERGTLRFWGCHVMLFKSLTGRDIDKESTRIQC
jgi:hypothetical protein